MAESKRRLPKNAPGKLYVDDCCLDHALCQELAPNNFARDEERGTYYVCKQPDTPEEFAQCMEAVRRCPMDAIGSDGDLSPQERVACAAKRSWWHRLFDRRSAT